MSPTFMHSISRSCRYIKSNSKLNQAKKLNLLCGVSLKVTMAPKEDKHAIFSLFCNLVALLLLQISVASAIPHYEENNYYINAAQADNSCPDALEVCQSAQVEGASDVSNYFSVCPDDGDPGNQNVCYYSNTPCCSPSIVPQLTSCNSSSTLLVAGTEVQVTFLNLFTPGNNVPDEVCFQVEPDLSHCNEECVIPCLFTDFEVCFENTITGDVSSCNAGICTCKDGHLPPDCCQCDTNTHYLDGTVCKPFCRENCIGSGPNGGCAACKEGFITAPECCDCAEPGTRPVNGICVCDKEQDLYFLIDATISYDYTHFCSMMIVAQMLAAAFNPTNSSGTKLYGVLFQNKTDVEKVFDLGDSCNTVSNQLKTLTKDFSVCKKSAYGETTFKSVCASKTIAIKGLQEIEKEAKVSTKEQKAVLILTDGTIDDPDNELGTVKSSLKLAGIETIIAARVGTDQVNDNLKKYANIDSNAIVADEPIKLGLKIVERLSAEGILCNDHAERIKDSLKVVSEMTATLPYFCKCVPEVVSGKGCSVTQSGTEFTLKFPECGGSLNIELIPGSKEAAKQGDSKLKAETKLLEEEIFAAVEKVLDTFEG